MNDTKSVMKVVLGIVIIIIIRGIGIDNIPTGIVITILFAAIVYFTWSIFTFKINAKEKKYFRIFAVILILLITVFMIMYIIEKKYPQFISTAKPILLPVTIILYCAVAVSVFVWIIMRSK